MEELPGKFCSLEEDYIECKRSINNSINELAHSTNTDLVHQASQTAQSNIVEAQRYVKLMAIEVRGKSPATRKIMQSKISGYREEIKALQRDFDRALLFRNQQKLEGNIGRTSDSHYERLQKSNAQLQKSSDTVDQSRRLVAETEEIGISVLDNLSQQRETLLSARDKVEETRMFSGEARSILKRMTRRMFANRMVLWAIIGILIISIVFVFYHDFIKPSSA